MSGLDQASYEECRRPFAKTENWGLGNEEQKDEMELGRTCRTKK